MPTYLCHGFRWQRRSVRVYVILQNLDDASPEWIIPAKSSQCILKSFYEVFEFLPYCSPKRGRYTPTRELDSGDGNGNENDDSRVPNSSNGSTKARSQSRGRNRSQSQSTHQSRSQSRANLQQPLPSLPATTDDSSSGSISAEDDFSAQSWSAIKLLEEYDPNDLTAVSRPYAYVADYAVRIDLSCSIIDEIAKYEQKQLQSAHPAVSIPSRESTPGNQGWFEDLRDQLQNGEELRWYVVVNNDEVRDWADEGSESTTFSGPPERGYQHQPDQAHQHPLQQASHHHSEYQAQHQQPPGRPIPSREQKQHHAQYIHQQHIFEGSDREKDQALEKVQTIERVSQDQNRGRPQQQQQLVFGESDQQRKQDEEKRQQQLLAQKREQQRKKEEEKRQQLEQSQRQLEREQEEEQQRLAWRELELKKARQRERERQRQREREKELERERERERERQRKKEEEKSRPRDQIPPATNGIDTNGIDTNGTPPMVPEKDFFFPRPPTAKSNANTNTNTPPPPPPPLRPKISLDFGRPKTPGAKGGGLRRLFSRAKVPADGRFSP